MRKNIGIGGLLAVLVLAGLGSGAGAAEEGTWIGPANNAFGTELYSQLALAKGNLFFSPSSIETALAMTYAGARGDTAQQMAKVLHLPEGVEVHKGLAAFFRELNAEKGADGKPRRFQLTVANALWGQKEYKFLPEFLTLVKDNYGAGLEEVDFIRAREAAARTINAWVEGKTNNKIKNLVLPDALTSLTRLVLTNAIYFKGNWARQFDKKLTKDEPFHLSPEKEVQTPMMNIKSKYGYGEGDGYQVLKMLYAGDELSMVILLPKKNDGLAELEKSLTEENLTKWISGIREREVIVAMPRFKMEARFELGDTLTKMGMADAFSETKADFSGMTGKKDLYIARVIHKAFVDVNEEGTEAAAATAVIMATKSAMVRPKPLVFRADHPFLFLIRHEKSGAILFAGRLMNPKD